ncbi:MAG: hypothetical protein US46_C0001G0068 [Candidatus Shapirobacteria bacterium GW2011_GWF2_37_20]|nr:MAG: hypothetical protein US46_C0001G0068 [Candidatus Shapirobacteria bacterium GW2011_GWF2_37_20]
MISNYKRGQVAIIVLLVSAMMMTLGLSLSKKATTETRIDINEELLKKAFNAAESGIDYYLGTGNLTYNAPDNLSSAEITARDITGEGNILDFGEYVPINGSEFYWLVNHLDNGDIGVTYYGAATVNVCGTGFTGSMEINYFYKTGAEYGVNRYGYNFSSDVTKQVNGFTAGTGGCATINIVNSPILITVTPIFNGGRFYLSGSGTFPIQGVEISSRGRSGGVSVDVSETQANKKLIVLRRYKIPSFMLSGVVSETSVLSD